MAPDAPADGLGGLGTRLQALVDAHEDLEREMADPAVAGDGRRYNELARRHAELAPIVATHAERQQVLDDLAAAREMATEVDEGSGDAELLAQEVAALEQRVGELTDRLRLLLVPPDPDDDRDVIVEVRSAAGGDEAGLFAGELRDMYVAFAQRRGWQVEQLDASEQSIGGINHATFAVRGSGAWAHLKHESGVHRVQRVPATESQGRIHTSTASVAVLPVAEDVEVALDPNDVKVDVFRSSGPGGQSVNTTDSAVRLTHLPTGIVVTCQDQKSQHQNRDRARQVLRSRLLAAEREAVRRERTDARRGQIGTGDRSEKIRTYNFPQSRVTDHRVNLTVHNLADVLGGDLDEVVGALREAERVARLEAELADGAAAGGGTGGGAA